MFKINGYHPLTLPIEDIADGLTAFEKTIAEEQNGHPLVEYHGKRHARAFHISRLPDSLYHRIITDEVIDMLTHYYGREPCVFDSIFLYSKAHIARNSRFIAMSV